MSLRRVQKSMRRVNIVLRNCEECNRVFAHPSRRLCEDCYQKEQEQFTAVKEYLQENPGASVAEVAKATEVDLDTIYEFIREGRLHIIPSDVEFQCEICGDTISTGRVCSKCRAEFRKSSYVAPEPENKSQSRSSRVHYLDQIKDRR